jgi:transposase
MPQSHRKHMEWSPGRFLNWANQTGPRTRDLVRHLLQDKPHPEHGYRACLGLLGLSRKYTPQRLEAACERALGLRAPNYRSVKSILETGLDRRKLPPQKEDLFTTPGHENVRGPHYYQ